MSEIPERDDELLADLLAIYDTELAAGGTTEPSAASTVHDVPGELVGRYETAKKCLQLLEGLWPRHRREGRKPIEQVGRFEIVRELGRGGCGIVFLAFDPKLHRRVALKLPQSSWLVSSDLQGRFLREAEAAARLNHLNIIAVYEVGEVDSTPYIAAEYCAGPTLTNWLAAHDRPVPVRDAAWFVGVLASAMQHAHARGVLHRDLNPNNILLEPAALAVPPHADQTPDLSAYSPKISDFGLAKLVETEFDGTRTGAVLGTLTHMAPEQAEGRVHDISVQTDVYALGVILYQLLTGVAPHHGQTAAETLQRILLADPRSPRQLRSDVPRDLAAICLKCLEKQPTGRYASAAELAKDLQNYLDGKPTRAVALSGPQRAWRWARRRPAVAALISVSVAASLAMLLNTVAYQSRLSEAMALTRREAETSRKLLYASDLRLAHEAWQTHNVSEAKAILGRQAMFDYEGAGRDFTWRYLWNAMHGEAQTLKGHVGDVYHVAFSADDRRLASCGKDRTIRLWDAASGKQQLVMTGHRDEVNHVAFATPDLLLSASDDGTVKSWDVRTGRCEATVDLLDGPLTALAVSADGQQAAFGGVVGVVHVWEPQSGLELWSTPAFDMVDSVAFSPDGQLLVTGYRDGAIRFWDVRSHDLLAEHKVTEASPLTIAISSSLSQVAALSRTGSVCLYRPLGGKWLPTAKAALTSKAIGSHAAAFSPRDNALAVGTRDGLVSLWNTGARLQRWRVLPGHDGRVWSTVWSSDGTVLASSGSDGTIKLWNALKAPDGKVEFANTIGAPLTMAVSRDSRTAVTVGDDALLRIWDLERRQLVASLPDFFNSFSSACFIEGDASIAAVDATGHVRRVGREGQLDPQPLLTSASAAWSVSASSDGSLLAVGFKNHAAGVYDSCSGRQLQAFECEMLDVRRAVLSPNGQLLATGGFGPKIEVWDVQTGRLLHALSGHANQSMCMVFSPDHRTLISGGSDELVKFWDLETGQLRRTLVGQLSAIGTLAITLDGRTLASGSYMPHALRLWDLGTNGQLLGSMNVDQPVTSLAFSADADTLYAGAGNRNSAHLIEWSAYRHHGLDARQTDAESMLALVPGAEQTVSQPPAEPDAVRLLQRASQSAQARGYALGYPLFATLPNGNQQCVGVRNVLNREIWVPLTDFLPEASRPQATYSSSDELIKGISESASVWAQERGFTCAVPTLFGRHDADGIPSYGLTLLWGPGLTPKRVRVTEQAASVAAIVRRVHGQAVSQGFASGIPTFLMRDGRVQCIFLAADVAELFEVPASELADSDR